MDPIDTKIVAEYRVLWTDNGYSASSKVVHQSIAEEMLNGLLPKFPDAHIVTRTATYTPWKAVK